MKRYKQGEHAYFLESNRIVKRVQILKVCGTRYMIQFIDSHGAIMVNASKLYETQEEAEFHIPKRQEDESYKTGNTTGYKAPELH